MKHDIVLVCGGVFHEIDFARLEILKLLYETEDIKVRVFEDFSNTEAIREADGLVTYTCNVLPSPKAVQALGDFLGAGKRWFALHATSSIIDIREDGAVDSPRSAPEFMGMLGSQFIAHPIVHEFEVKNVAEDHPLVQGVDNFRVTDELYLSEMHGEIIPLLQTSYKGQAPGFVESDWEDEEPRTIMYLHPWGSGGGEVLYLTLGHCRGKYDMQPIMDVYPMKDRCAWETEEYYELLRRGICWLMDR